jgi:hypothetical protein
MRTMVSPFHRGFLDLDLGERVVHVGAGQRGRADDDGLGERRDAAAEPVELAAVGIGAAERGEQDGVALGAGRRQVPGVEDQAAARAPPHVDRAHLPLLHL